MDYMLTRFEFKSECRSWMCPYVFSRNLTVLVNGCMAQEIIIQQGLKQGNLLVIFLFLLVTEGLSRLFAKVVDLSVFHGVRVCSLYLKASHLQYVNYSIILADGWVDG